MPRKGAAFDDRVYPRNVLIYTHFIQHIDPRSRTVVIGKCLKCLEVLGVALVILVNRDSGYPLIESICPITLNQMNVTTILLPQTRLNLREAFLLSSS